MFLRPAERTDMEEEKFYGEPDYGDINLSDFILFLSVMKDKRAYRNTVSMILEEPDIEIREVKVEQVVLNQSGKQAIRLDAWAVAEDDRLFNMEMENHSERDSIPKRSRFYQGLLDSPVLKSGRNTRYRELPQTVIIFITQDDIFKCDRAKYTFTERCEEVENLRLEDGTKKIFLNMSSKNGSKELVSLLQYMKNTSLDNPDILVMDERLVELDGIVAEVKSSEEWEEVRMTIYDMGVERGIKQGIEQGIEKGIEQGICAFVMDYLEEKRPREQILGKLEKRFGLDAETALKYYEECAEKASV